MHNTTVEKNRMSVERKVIFSYTETGEDNVTRKKTLQIDNFLARNTEKSKEFFSLVFGIKKCVQLASIYLYDKNTITDVNTTMIKTLNNLVNTKSDNKTEHLLVIIVDMNFKTPEIQQQYERELFDFADTLSYDSNHTFITMTNRTVSHELTPPAVQIKKFMVYLHHTQIKNSVPVERIHLVRVDNQYSKPLGKYHLIEFESADSTMIDNVLGGALNTQYGVVEYAKGQMKQIEIDGESIGVFDVTITESHWVNFVRQIEPHGFDTFATTEYEYPDNISDTTKRVIALMQPTQK